MSTTVTANNGIQLPVDSLEHEYGYVGDNLTTDTIIYQELTYIKTFSYSGTNVISESQWEVQP